MSYSQSEVAKLLAANPDLSVDTTGIEPVIRQAMKQAKPSISEHDMQVAVIAECDRRAVLRPEWGLIFAIPNGGQRHAAVAAKLKAEGVRAGVPDLCVPVRRHGYGAMFLELKIGANKPTEAQRDWLRWLQMEGYFCKTIWDSADEVIQLIEWYLEGNI